MSVQVATHINEAIYIRNTVINPKDISAGEVEPGESDGLPYGWGCMKGKMWMADDFDEPLEFATVPEKKPKRTREEMFGSARGRFNLPDDFNEPLEDFKEYME